MTGRRLSKDKMAACAAIALLLAGCGERPAAIDPLAQGAKIYSRYCGACHGANLEGQPNWRSRLPTGRLPAPPHDASGHTWHHPMEQLFAITKFGLVPPNAPKGYESDMPAFAGTLSDDEIRAVFAFIESRWPKEVREAREEMLAKRRR